MMGMPTSAATTRALGAQSTSDLHAPKGAINCRGRKVLLVLKV